MKNITANCDRQACNLTFVPPDRQGVEESLRRVFVAAVPRIDHGTAHFLRKKFDGSGRVMAHDKQVRPHGIERHGRVYDRLTLLDG